MVGQKIIMSGKRKTSVARAVLTEGTGKISINDLISFEQGKEILY